MISRGNKNRTKAVAMNLPFSLNFLAPKAIAILNLAELFVLSEKNGKITHLSLCIEYYINMSESYPKYCRYCRSMRIK